MHLLTIVTVLEPGIPCHVATCTSAASIGGVGRQNPQVFVQTDPL
jgi:hypothetical protein